MIDKDSKSRLRKKFLKIRRKITDKERKTISLNLKLLTILIKKKEKKIAAYFSVRNELVENELYNIPGTDVIIAVYTTFNNRIFGNNMLYLILILFFTFLYIFKKLFLFL